MSERGADKKLTARELASDQEIRWCPGCGDFAILKQVQSILPDSDIPKENIVFISGIGCSSRFPYYMNTYGMHSIHGRATAVATGLKTARPELDVWVITGDGDGLSIGGNHLIHLLRRNVNLSILLFNNQIYGLTKGQYSPTSEQFKQTKSSPGGSLDAPLNPMTLALGADASFVARTADREARHQQEVLKAARSHKGASFVELYQNCLIFNDGVFDPYTDRKEKKLNTVLLETGKPLLFGNSNEYGIVLDGHRPKMVELKGSEPAGLWIHDPADLLKAQLLARFTDGSLGEAFPHPFGILYRNKDKATYDELAADAFRKSDSRGERLTDILKGNVHWTVE